ncbi:RHS repeat-associated core domain-containing protein, partial [Massilia sp. TSP1-1-2]|uniref:RHS repeat-associated core domain-containing protein n=1 Tax=Massilia sp. TSP1-1-2 TaxID=2804649 RepID=UPI003CF300F7
AQSIARYTYDAKGNRVGKSAPGLNRQSDQLTAYVIDGTFEYAQTVQESLGEGANAVISNYVWGAGLIEQVRDGQATYFHADGLGSVKALSDATGTARDTYEYDAFGGLEIHAGSTENRYRYTGEYFDEAIGLQYNRARWYDVSLGRFTAIDRLWGRQADPLSLHRYQYAHLDPVAKSDPSGLVTLIGLNTNVSVSAIGASATQNLARVTINNIGGQAF